MIDRERRLPPLRWVLSSEPAQVAKVRAVVREALPEELPRREDVIVVVGELAANSVAHSDSPRTGTFAVEILLLSTCVVLAVHDDGADTVPHLVPDPPDPLEHLDLAPEAFEHGRGLRLVEGYADRWGYAVGDGRCTVWAAFDLLAKSPDEP